VQLEPLSQHVAVALEIRRTLPSVAEPGRAARQGLFKGTRPEPEPGLSRAGAGPGVRPARTSRRTCAYAGRATRKARLVRTHGHTRMPRTRGAAPGGAVRVLGQQEKSGGDASKQGGAATMTRRRTLLLHVRSRPAPRAARRMATRRIAVEPAGGPVRTMSRQEAWRMRPGSGATRATTARTVTLSQAPIPISR
jgi:hypothetical protein